MKALGATGLALALLAAPAAAQHPTADVGDVPSGPGAVEGRVVHATRPGGVAGVDVVLYALGGGGRPGVRRTTSDAEGAFRFEGIATGAGAIYLLGSRYDDVPFIGERVVFAPGELERSVTLSVADRTRDADAVVVEEATLRLARSGAQLVVAEGYRLRNSGDRVVYATLDEREAGARPALRALLPEAALHFTSPFAFHAEGLTRDGRDVHFFGPLYPGVQEITFTYVLEAQEGEWVLHKTYPSGAARVAVLYPTAGLDVRSAALGPGDQTQVDGIPHHVLEAAAVGAGTRIALALDVPAARRDSNALRVVQSRTFLELDDAALRVNEEYHLEVAGDTPVVAAAEGPLLRIPLPREARDPRFGSTVLTGGIVFEDGALAVRGPLPPGSSRIDLQYRLPADPEGVRFDRRFVQAVPTVTIFVADTGLRVDSDRLHRRRPVKTPDDRFYMHFEAFRVQAGETLELGLVPLVRGARAPWAGRALFVVAAALALAFFLSRPLRGGEVEELAAGEPESARQEREALYTAIRDLDHDFETGKLAEDDYAAMRDELRGRAAALLRAEREGPPSEPAAPSACPDCGAPAAPEARFCSRCGRPLAAVPPAEASA